MLLSSAFVSFEFYLQYCAITFPILETNVEPTPDSDVLTLYICHATISSLH